MRIVGIETRSYNDVTVDLPALGTQQQALF